MKIVIGSESFAPNISGVAVATEVLASNLAREKHEVYVFAPSEKFKSHYDAKFKEFKVFRVKSVRNPFRKNFRFAVFASKDIFNELKKISPDLVHLQDPTAICGSIKKYADSKNIPVVITNHFSLSYILSYLRFLRPVQAQVKRLIISYIVRFYNSCRLVICPTETVRKDLLKMGVKTETVAISNGIDLERFFPDFDPADIKTKLHLPVNDLVLYVGRVDKDKSLDVLVKAIPLVLKECNAHFVIAGAGDWQERIKEQVKELNIQNSITFLGWIDNKSTDLIELYKAAKLFVIPSTIETQSIVTLEALASGLPVVAANAGALPELVEPDRNGYLFPPGNFKEMAKDIIDILKDKEKQSRMRRRSLKIVSNHKIDESFKKIMEV